MRLVSTLVMVFGMFLAVGCGDDSGAVDLGADLTAGGTDTCLQVVTCGQGCAGNASCEAACAAKGTAKAMTQSQALFGCAYGQCTVAHDGGAAACTSNTDGSAGCITCVTAAAQSPACASQLSACIGS
jgi:hypothetical protein